MRDLQVAAFTGSAIPRDRGCGPVLVVLPAVTFDKWPLLRSARKQGNVLRYVYIGRGLGEARSSGVLCRADEIRSARNVRPDAIRALRAPASRRLALIMRSHHRC